MHPLFEKTIVFFSLITGFFTGSIYVARGKVIRGVLMRNGREPLNFSLKEGEEGYEKLMEEVGKMISNNSENLKNFLEMKSIENNNEKIMERLEEKCGELLKSRGRKGEEKFENAKMFCSREKGEGKEK